MKRRIGGAPLLLLLLTAMMMGFECSQLSHQDYEVDWIATEALLPPLPEYEEQTRGSRREYQTSATASAGHRPLYEGDVFVDDPLSDTRWHWEPDRIRNRQDHPVAEPDDMYGIVEVPYFEFLREKSAPRKQSKVKSTSAKTVSLPPTKSFAKLSSPPSAKTPAPIAAPSIAQTARLHQANVRPPKPVNPGVKFNRPALTASKRRPEKILKHLIPAPNDSVMKSEIKKPVANGPPSSFPRGALPDPFPTLFRGSAPLKPTTSYRGRPVVTPGFSAAGSWQTPQLQNHNTMLLPHFTRRI